MIVARPNYPPLEPIPDGRQAAVLVNVFDLGIQASFPGERPKRKVALLWEFSVHRSDGTPFLVAKEYTATLADSSNLRAVLESWRGEPLTEAELEGFELDILKGRFCTLDLERRLKKNGRDTYVEVVGVYRARKGDPQWAPLTPEIYIPEWIAQKMSESIPPEALGDAGNEYVEERPY